MRLALISTTVFAALLLGSATTARADTHAPSTQHVTITCGSGTYDAVSPIDPAHGGQVIGTTVAIVALNVTATNAEGDIVFQTTTAGRNTEGETCSFTSDDLTVTMWAIVTPLGRS